MMKNGNEIICKCGATAKYNGYDIRHNYGVARYVCPACGNVIYNEDEIEVYDDREEL